MTVDRVRIYEVGPRDGLQHESLPISTDDKVEFVKRLAAAGLREIETTSFVSARAIPQLADADELLPRVLSGQATGVRHPVLVPNLRGFERAKAAGATALAVFTAATDAFTRRNIGMTVAESLAAFRPVLAEAAALGWWRRAYVSTAFGCPFSGCVPAAKAVDVAVALLDLGAEEVCYGDTIGVGVPSQVDALVEASLARAIAPDRIAFHFHDTRGTGLANVTAGLRAGIRGFDASTGGTGGCPYAPGASGNLATEDLVYLLDGLGYEHGVSLAGVLDAARFIAGVLGRPLATKVGQAGGWDPDSGEATARP
ncbi:MAG: hydroxymethylglutaryl-CoA lyase [Chloroflexi bacterium]|nr:hydroxymethylglutaryl-CoA lyase [Chloroflexota bacterium]